MADRTTNLSMPFILPSQAQKHVTHNEALQALDAIVQLTVESEVATPPPGASEGARFVVAADATGDWQDHDGEIAARQDGAWSFLHPREGWIAWFRDMQTLRIFRASVWSDLEAATPEFANLGVNASADSYNRLVVASEASLLTHVGHGHQAKINKATATDTATLLFQSNWTGHAEMGLAGNNDFSIKVSNGADWRTALNIGPNGTVSLPQRPTGRAYRSDGTVSHTAGGDSGFTGLDMIQGGVVLGTAIGTAGRALKVPESGLYLITALVMAAAPSEHGTSVVVNGDLTLFSLWSPPIAPLTQSHTQLVLLNAGDELSLRYTGTAHIYYAPGLTQLTIAML